MKKLIEGIRDFREKVLPERRHLFAALAKGQHPDALFITCSDSRVAPNWFASTDPGDLFVVRNVGNMIPPCGPDGTRSGDFSEFAAVEFAILALQVKDIVICGHSDCGAMHALAHQSFVPEAPFLKSWLSHASDAHTALKNGQICKGSESLDRTNQLSQINVLTQREHLKTYPLIRDRLESGKLRLHAWWFEIAKANIYEFDGGQQSFRLI